MTVATAAHGMTGASGLRRAGPSGPVALLGTIFLYLFG